MSSRKNGCVVWVVQQAQDLNLDPLYMQAFSFRRELSTHPDSPLYIQFKEWVLSMTEEQDDERGDETWQWILDKNALHSAADSSDAIYDTFVFVKNDGVMVATASLVEDDQLRTYVWDRKFRIHVSTFV